MLTVVPLAVVRFVNADRSCDENLLKGEKRAPAPTVISVVVYFVSESTGGYTTPPYHQNIFERHDSKEVRWVYTTRFVGAANEWRMCYQITKISPCYCPTSSEHCAARRHTYSMHMCFDNPCVAERIRKNRQINKITSNGNVVNTKIKGWCCQHTFFFFFFGVWFQNNICLSYNMSRTFQKGFTFKRTGERN